MRRRAFTFAEVLVCMFLLSCSVLGLLAGHHYLQRSERGNQARHHASLIGYDVMTVTLADAQADFAPSRSRPRTEVADGFFTYAVDDHVVQSGLKEITVSVYFQETTEREFRLSSRVYDVQ